MGAFITFEGGDGSGKGTQAKLTSEWLDSEGYNVTLESFPRYGQPVAEPISRFLNGEFGNPHPDLISIPYSLDRLMASTAIRASLDLPNGIVIADRFTNSNLGHNGSKLNSNEERLAFFEAQRTFEYETLGIPKPDHNLLLMVPPATAQQNVDRKAARSYTEMKRDIHEADETHLARTFETYQLLAATYPDEFTIIESIDIDTDTMRPIEDIQAELRRALRPLLNEQAPPQGRLF